jgi:hypothetical protein
LSNAWEPLSNASRELFGYCEGPDSSHKKLLTERPDNCWEALVVSSLEQAPDNSPKNPREVTGSSPQRVTDLP